MKSALRVAFEHHGWATARILDVCEGLGLEQWEYHLTGTYGSIGDTLVHLVESDGFYLAALGVTPELEPLEASDFRAMRARVESLTAAWVGFLEANPDPESVVEEANGESDARHCTPVGVYLAQALHHGSDHRSQICSALSALRLEAPDIDVWRYAEATGQLGEEVG